MRKKLLGFALASLAFALAEWLWLRPVLNASPRSGTVYAFLLAANLFYLYKLFFRISLGSRRLIAAYLAWYVALFLFFVVVSPGSMADRWRFGGEQGLHRQLLFGLFLLVTSAFFDLPAAFGVLVAVLIAYFVFPFFAEATLALMIVFYLVIMAELRHARVTKSYVVLGGFVLGFILMVAVLFPLIHLGTQRSPQDLDTLIRGTPQGTQAGGPEAERFDRAAQETRDAIWMSLQTATVSTLVVLLLGVPLAYFLVRSDFPGRSILDAMVDLPIVLPPPVAGLALVFILGPEPGIGSLLREKFGLQFANDWKGIVLAQVFVSSPFLVRSAQAAFQAVDPKLEHVSRTLGATPLRTLWRVTLPLAARGIFMGCILTWGRAIGEFGSVSVIAQHPETMPVRIYTQFVTSGEKGPSLSLAILMIFLCVSVFAGLHLLASRTLWRNVRTMWGHSGDSSGRTAQTAG
jgi:NifC-like ABC-type porter